MADTSTLIPFGGEDNTALSAGLGGLMGLMAMVLIEVMMVV